MNLTQDGTSEMPEEDLLAKLGMKPDGQLCDCLQRVVGEGKGPEDLHAEDADKAIAMMAAVGGSLLLSAMHVTTSLMRAGIVERVLAEAAEESAKMAFISMLLGSLPTGPDGPGGLPGLQVLELGPKDFERRDDAGDPGAMRDGIL